MENSTYQEELESMSKFRDSLIKKYNERLASDDEIEQIDVLADEIVKYIKNHFDFLSFDFIMQQLSYLGWCPNLLNDDNGYWAVTGEGFQNVVIGDEPSNVNLNFFVQAKEWKSTPKEALLYYLTENDNE